MSTAKEEIENILSRCGASESQRLREARLFARSMLVELGGAVAEWQQVAEALDGITADDAKGLRAVTP